MKYSPMDFKDIKTYPIAERNNKVNLSEFAREPIEKSSFKEFFYSMPNLLAVNSLDCIVAAIKNARMNKRPVVFAIGGHVIKCGLQPVLKKLIEKNIITAVAMNGAAAIHDYELSLIGETSEEVGDVLNEGTFGFAEETLHGINKALQIGCLKQWGYGKSIGTEILNNKYKEYSLLAACVENDIPATVHVALGTDIVHQTPEADGATIGKLSMQDFRLITSVVADISGGVWVNIGSAVILPEVFLKAFSIAQNLGHNVEKFTTANFDMVQHYRPRQNVLNRPNGNSYSITGHHEIMIPLLAHAVLERL